MVQRAVLCILDGYGCHAEVTGNAIAQARTPNFDALWGRSARAELAASGLAVGLPEGQQGNSEVGHLTIGSGRVVLQDLTRIDAAIDDGSFFQNEVLRAALGRSRGSRLHLVGLVSPGGVHSHQDHLVALAEMAGRMGVADIAVHAVTDGRDTSPEAGAGYLEDVGRRLAAVSSARFTSISGRYYAMDRDRRWGRVQLAFLTMMGRPQRTAHDAAAYARASYADGVYDEFLLPAAIVPDGEEPVGVRPGDIVVHFNFRPDRARELSHALVDLAFASFDRGPWSGGVDLVTFTSYDDTLEVPVAFPKPEVRNTLAQVVAEAGLAQFHVAETEKYAHVTYFVNGGREDPFPRERRVLVPSSKVATYDLKPEMSATGITDAAVAELEREESSLLVMNYANADMVGHTGDLAATIRAVEFLDSCLGRLAQSAEATGYRLLVTADHGNAECMVDEGTGAAVTAHSTSPVPVILTSGPGWLRRGGGLRDVAPTILSVMGLPVPAEMTGEDLRRVR